MTEINTHKHVLESNNLVFKKNHMSTSYKQICMYVDYHIQVCRIHVCFSWPNKDMFLFGQQENILGGGEHEKEETRNEKVII